MFGANLRQLASNYPSISELARRLRINRTQFNRYLSGESFPRPDVLARICEFFEVDARVLLEPVANLRISGDPLTGDFLDDYLGTSANAIPESFFPSGFYRFSRRSFLDPDRFVLGLVRVFRTGEWTYVRGLEAKAAMRAQGLPVNREAREFRGVAMRQDEGIALLISRKGGITSSYNFLSRVTSFENNYWVGYVARPTRESTDGERVVRMVYEHVGTDFKSARQAARFSGYTTVDKLLPFHQRLLHPEAGFR